MSLNVIAVSEETGVSKGPMELPADMIADGNPISESFEAKKLPVNGTLRTGIWVGQPGTIKINGYPTDEVMTVVQGRLEMTNEDGSVIAAGPGQTVFMPKGWKGLFRVAEPTKKCFVTVG